jgi:protein-S-isoprenylcysteine O-methyltransferase Ste14
MKNIFVSLGKFFFKYRDGLFPVIYIILLLFIRPGLFLADAHLDKYVCAAGILILLLGQIFRIVVIGFAYIKRGGRGGKVFAESLVKTGFFAHVRNPMYVGNYLIIVGLVMRGIKKSLETYQFNWLKVLRKEYGSIFFITCAWLSILIWKDITLYGYDQKHTEINILLMLFIPIILFYGITLYLKLRGHLDKHL